MPITERTLRKWRKEALWTLQRNHDRFKGESGIFASAHLETCKRILRMTQELLDQHLLGRSGGRINDPTNN